MAQQGEINQNQNVQGLFTEGSPLNFPAGATVRDENFILNTDGSRERRLGLGLEASYTPSGSVQFYSTDKTFVFDWDAVGNDGNKNYAAVFSDGFLVFYDKSAESLSSGLVTSFSATVTTGANQLSATPINGKLVITGLVGDEIQVFYEEDQTIKKKTYNIKVRDIWGVDDSLEVDQRSKSLTSSHAYNLANQGWNYRSALVLREGGDGPQIWPSNADVYTLGISPDVAKSFFDERPYVNPPFGNTPSAKGSAIAELTNMGQDRLDHAVGKGFSNVNLSDVADYNATGPRACASYAGRVFYAGFINSSNAVNDTYPDLTSLIAFSQSVYKDQDINRCYQEADPADENGSIVASDGGTLQIAGSGFIYKLLPAGRSLIVFASEGVWEIYSTDQLFSATNYQIRKISDIGCHNPQSVILVESVPMYWTDYGIYALQPDQVSESFVASNITADTIQTYYDDIDAASTRRAVGFYDKFDKKARWLFSSDGDLPSNLDTELVFDSRLQSWYTNVYPTVAGKDISGMVSLNAFSEISGNQGVISQADNVIVGTDEVVVPASIPEKGKRSYKYLVNNTVNSKYEFFEFNRADFKDFGEQDAQALMITGPYTGGDSVRRKNSSYLIMQLRKTELGYTEVGDELQPVNPGSCLVEAKWDWTDNSVAGKFVNPIEMYRHQRHYIPTGPSDGYDNGYPVMTTKSRLRGSGRALTLQITSSPEKDLNILGWNIQITQNEKV